MNKFTVMLIDDDEIFLSLTQLSLKQNYYVQDIYCFSCGVSALKYLESCDEQNCPFPYLIFVDINMPDIDGFEFVTQFENKFFDKYPGTKLMMLTSSISKKEKAKGMGKASVKGFLEKPLTDEVLQELMMDMA